MSVKGFNLEFRDDHVHIELGSDYVVSAEARIQFWDYLKQVCETHGTKRVLIEGTLPEGERETIEIIDAGQKTATVSYLWMAFSFKDFIANEQSELFEVIAATQGVRVKFFTERDEALNWLRRNAPA